MESTITPVNNHKLAHNTSTTNAHIKSTLAAELLEVRFLLSDSLTLRCEIYLNTDTWSLLEKNPQFRDFVLRVIERIASGCSQKSGAHHAKSEGI
ncbi:hypothetical protein PAN31117_04127 [Pandoraea anapnoica]|uniref:Uncharacterized protein n=1 Tax=Pandoraea anapnoica TaxID=2508301 RepID=A0A5E5ADI5_9BURK|nr:hypothetical protein PAN31117_04127 [Pandoraea anapnoica]